MTPEHAYDILEKDPNHKDRESLEHTIGSDAFWSYNYARCIHGNETGLPLRLYGIETIEGAFCGERFELGEAAISKDAELSFWYAKYVIRGSWTQELAVMCPCWLFFYAKDVSKGRLPKAMHNKMISFGIIDSSDKYVKKYLGSKKYCTLKDKDTKHDSRNSVFYFRKRS